MDRKIISGEFSSAYISVVNIKAARTSEQHIHAPRAGMLIKCLPYVTYTFGGMCITIVEFEGAVQQN